MPLEEKTLKFLSLYKSDVDRMKALQEVLMSGHDRVNFDPRALRLVYTRGAQALVEYECELIGSYSSDDEIFRWAWAARRNGADAQRVDAIYKEGQNYHIEQLNERAISRPGEQSAYRIADTAAALAKAHGIFVADEGRRHHFYACFTDPRVAAQAAAMRPKMAPTVAIPSTGAKAPPAPPTQGRKSIAPPGMGTTSGSVMARMPTQGVPARPPPPPGSPGRAQMARTQAAPAMTQAPSQPVSATQMQVAHTPSSSPMAAMQSVAPMPLPGPPPMMGQMAQTQAMGVMSPMALQQMQMAAMQQASQMAATQAMASMMPGMMQNMQNMQSMMPGMAGMLPPLGAVAASSQTLDPERARARFTPCAEAAIRFLVQEVPAFQQAVVVIAGAIRDPRIYMPVLVVVDGDGAMRCLDPSPVVVEASQQFVMSEYQAGALFWGRLEARVSKKPTGGVAITIHMT